MASCLVFRQYRPSLHHHDWNIPPNTRSRNSRRSTQPGYVYRLPSHSRFRSRIRHHPSSCAHHRACLSYSPRKGYCSVSNMLLSRGYRFQLDYLWHLSAQELDVELAHPFPDAGLLPAHPAGWALLRSRITSMAGLQRQAGRGAGFLRQIPRWRRQFFHAGRLRNGDGHGPSRSRIGNPGHGVV